MRPKVSNAEIEVFKALSGEGLTKNMVTQNQIILKSTVPDFCWLDQRKVVYLDGVQAHSSRRAQQRDEEINDLLEAQGWEVLRITYKPPLKEKDLKGIMETIKKFLNNEDK